MCDRICFTHILLNRCFLCDDSHIRSYFWGKKCLYSRALVASNFPFVHLAPPLFSLQYRSRKPSLHIVVGCSSFSSNTNWIKFVVAFFFVVARLCSEKLARNSKKPVCGLFRKFLANLQFSELIKALNNKRTRSDRVFGWF